MNLLVQGSRGRSWWFWRYV